ncbi:hypothetical protein BT93_K0541 [Corymbia citriodora subsp. variegata]|nr:hypothetical protein BT93_K0541 [Corymbia citriodora subsp. variegata]
MLPSRLLPRKYNLFKFFRLPTDDGRLPDNLFPFKNRITSFLRFPISRGMLPESWFCPKSMTCKPTRFLKLVGMIPYNLFWFKRSVVKVDEKLPRHSGKAPLRLLLFTASCSKLLALVKEQMKSKSSTTPPVPWRFEEV